MKLAVFGATGPTGIQLTRQALERGHEVTVLARHPEALEITHPRLRVVRGDVLEPADSRPVVAGADAVISALGIGYRRHTTTVYSAGTRNILAAMDEAGVRRLLVVSTSSLDLPRRRELALWLVVRCLLHPMLHRPYADCALMEEIVRQSPADWTIARAARLTGGQATGRYRIAVNDRLRGSWSISRADLAGYLLDQAASPASSRATVEIAY
jgi:putative NADH-flavin reductase